MTWGIHATHKKLRRESLSNWCDADADEDADAGADADADSSNNMSTSTPTLQGGRHKYYGELHHLREWLHYTK